MRNRIKIKSAILLLLAAALAAPAAADQLHPQSFVLEPGWNAIYLEVQPAANDADGVFQGLPIESVWTWNPRLSPVEFIQDPSEPELQSSGWLGYFPPSRLESFLTDLHQVYANRAYLVKLGGTAAVTWTVTGRPALSRARWVPDSYNLVGMAVAETLPPTFGDFFAPSPAHTGQAVWRLAPDGRWRQVTDPFATPMRSGESFWIYTAGASGYAGPLGVEVGQGDGLDFAASLDELELVLTNRSSRQQTFAVRLLAGGDGAVAYRLFDAAAARFEWRDLPRTLVLDAGEQRVERLAVRRNRLSRERLDTILQVSDGVGSRRLVPLAATRLGVPPAGARSARKSHGDPFAGLWMGTVSVDQVAEVHATLPDVPTATASTFDFRILIHVDSVGQARLLKEVIQMWQNGDGGIPGHYVLVTRDDLVPNFQGAALRDGEPVGRRLSTAALDFGEGSGDAWDESTRTLSLNGNLGLGATLDVVFTLAADHPTNPYFHRYHNEHDSAAESYAVTRTLTLAVATDDPLAAGGSPRPDWGTRRLAGTYRESLDGLHRNTLYVGGTFSLRRVSDQEELNQ